MKLILTEEDSALRKKWFGTPLDITLASLKVEHLFPSDEETRAALAGAGGP